MLKLREHMQNKQKLQTQLLLLFFPACYRFRSHLQTPAAAQKQLLSL